MSIYSHDIKILLEEPDFAIIDKPAGLLVHQTGKNLAVEHSDVLENVGMFTLADWVVEKYPETKKVGDDPKTRPGIVHRLDQETSGVLCIARTQEFFEYFKKLLQTGKVKKTYLALAEGEVKSPQTINAPIGLISGTTKRSTRGKKMKMIKPAITEIEPVKILETESPKISKKYTLLKVYPKTGRTHQIRVHLASIHHPIVGDKIYGGKKRSDLGLTRHFLHASSLEFSTRDGRRVKIESEIPAELEEVLRKVGHNRF